MIQKEFEHITSTLLKGASNGLTLSIVVHELEKILMEMQRYVAISADKVPNKLVNLIGHLRDTVFSYTKIIKGKSKKNIKISEIIDDALFNIEYRLRCHETTIIDKYSKADGELKIVKGLIMNSILNIIDNSIFWLGYAGVKEKKILIKVIEDESFYKIIIADNGPGFNISGDQARQAFISGKPNDNGMGLGLHLVDQIMISHNAFLKIGTSKDFKLEHEFNGGGVISLEFEK